MALASLLRAHGLAMNGGVLHAVECLSLADLSRAASGYRYYGIDSIADLLFRARRIFEAGQELETNEALLDHEYASWVPDDGFLVQAFERVFESNPGNFAGV